MFSSKTMENLIVILLTMISGCADAISFLELGQVLTAAMTGNTVFLGLSFVHAGGLKSIGYITALGGFILGVAAGAIVLRNKQRITGLNSTVTFALCIQLAVFILFGVLISFTNLPNHILLILILSFGMGVQGVTARRIGVNGVPTTVITSTTTGLIESLVWNVKSLRTAQHTPNVPYASIGVWIIDIAIYCVGAALCGAVALKWHLHAIWLPAAIIFVVILASLSAQSERNKLTNIQSNN